MRYLITGGAGFVGSSLARQIREHDASADIVAFDNLRRRGSELNIAELHRLGVDFTHGDIRQPGDLEAIDGTFDIVIDASAEPSVHAGIDGSPNYVVQTNLLGTINCLELVRRRAAGLVFLSTSRVYSIRPLQDIPLREGRTRLEVPAGALAPAGFSEHGIAEGFATHLPRSLYGATKLASELLIQEYVEMYGVRAVINRCGVIAGPGQFGKVDQGVYTMWVARHLFDLPLRYTGFGGTGKQVRDILHPDDLFVLLRRQLDQLDRIAGETYNVGGGHSGSTSLLELTELCRDVTGNAPPIASDPHTAAVDIPYFVCDSTKAAAQFDWQPRLTVRDIVTQIASWLDRDRTQLQPLFV